MASRVADIIKRANLLNREDFAKALEFSTRDNIPFGLFVLKNGFTTEELYMRALSEGLGLQPLNLKEADIEPAVLNLVPRDLAIQYHFIPVNRIANNLIAAMGDPTNIDILDSLAARVGHKIKPVLASELDISAALEKYYVHKKEEARVTKSSAGGEEPEDSLVIGYVERMMLNAAQRKVSDIHIEPFETSLRVRFRLDGSLLEYENKARLELKNAITSRVKIISGLNITETRLPQDGNAKIDIPGYGKMDFRVSCLPTVYGEKIVLRLLDKSNLQLDMTKLGFDTLQLKDFQDAIHKPYGMVLVTGPTGSGKTTTLYSALAELNRLADNVVTAEDPVEFTLPGITQVQIRADIGLTFAAALKSFLRQDPDIIMLGEIRDAATTEIAIKAALTGHVVLSTMHTNTAVESIERLRNLGVEDFTIVSSLNAIVAQRLVRKICTNCKTEADVPVEEQIVLGLPKKHAGCFKIYKGQGCNLCNGTGYKGRAAIYEVMPMSEPLRKAIGKGLNILDLKHIAMQNGMQTLRQSAWKKVIKGITTIEELLDASNEDFEEPKKKAG